MEDTITKATVCEIRGDGDPINGDVIVSFEGHMGELLLTAEEFMWMDLDVLMRNYFKPMTVMLRNMRRESIAKVAA